GAWRMMRHKILVKRPRTVETLGAATVICIDKTGTITENRMELAAVHLYGEPAPRRSEAWDDDRIRQLLSVAMWASEPVPFDPMEIALHAAYGQRVPIDERPRFRMVHEYPLSGRPPMMTHIFADDAGRHIIAAKGAPEAIIACSDLTRDQRAAVMTQVEALAEQGLRVLAVSEAPYTGASWPATQQEFRFTYL